MAETTFHSITLPGANPARVPLTAVEFSTSTAYKVRDYCTYQGKLYICSTAHAAGAWNAAHFTEVNVCDEINTRLVVPPTTEPASTDRRVGDLWIDTNTESPVISIDPQPVAGSTNVPQSGGTFNLIKNLDNNKASKSLLTGNFDATKPYSVNQLCIHDGYLYRCKVDIPTGAAWNASKWQATTIETELARIESEEVDLDVIAETFGDSNSYAVGDYVLHTTNGVDKLYRCTSAVSDTSVWNSQYWSEVKLADEVSDLKSALNVVERFSMDFLENGAATDNDYYKSLETFLTNGKYYAFGITATETCSGRLTTNYLPNAANKVEDVGEYSLTANTEYIVYGYNPASTVAYIRLAKLTQSGITSVAWSLKVYEIKQKANQSSLDTTNSAVEALDDKIDVVDSYVKDIVAEFGKNTESYSNLDFTDDKIYNANGTYTVYGGNWISTDFISCVGYTEMKYRAEAFYDSRYSIDVAFVAFFDMNKTMTSCFKSSDYTNGTQSGTTTIPTGTTYVRVVGVSNKTCSLELLAGGFVKKIDDVWNNVESDLKICCIGDSLTEGVDGMSGNTPNVIAENYPYFMGKYLNATILNYGKAGTSPNTWWANLQSYGFTFDPSIDVVLIMFGTNGNMNVNTLATDVEPYNNWHDYANTGVGCYCKIIEYIMEQTNNHAQFILCTAPFNHYDEDDYYQRAKKSVNTTKAIAERYLLPVIDVYYESGLNDFNGDVFRPHDNLHFSAKGYHKLGTFIGSQTKAYLSRFSLDDEYADELPIT